MDDHGLLRGLKVSLENIIKMSLQLQNTNCSKNMSLFSNISCLKPALKLNAIYLLHKSNGFFKIHKNGSSNLLAIYQIIKVYDQCLTTYL